MTRNKQYRKRKNRRGANTRPSRSALRGMTADGKLSDPRPFRIRIVPVTVPLSWPGPDIAVSTSGASGGVIVLKKSDFPSHFASYQAIFDQFKILQWSVTFSPPNPQIGTGSTNVNLGLLHTAIDFDDQTNPTAASDLQTYSTYRFARHPRVHKREVKAMYPISSANDTYYVGPKWTSTALSDIELNGVKWVHDQVVGITNGQVLYKTTISAIFKFRLSK